jgi:hypothetical protein
MDFVLLGGGTADGLGFAVCRSWPDGFCKAEALHFCGDSGLNYSLYFFGTVLGVYNRCPDPAFSQGAVLAKFELPCEILINGF